MNDISKQIEEYEARGGKINVLPSTARAIEYGGYVRVPECNNVLDKVMTEKEFREKGRKGAAEYKRRMEAKKR